MRTTWSFYSAGRLLFGRGGIGEIGAACAREGWRRVLLVADRNLERLGLVDRVRAPLLEAGLEVQPFLEGEAEPAVRIAVAAAECARGFGPDMVLGLGGGSNMDLAKVTAVVARHGGRPQDYFGFDQVPGPVAPLVCVPTTAGTGSEVSHAAVLTDTDAGIKVSTLSPYLRPRLAVVDPALTDGCPRQVTADSGIDALTHAVEAITATDYHSLDLAPGETCAYEGRHPLGEVIGADAVRRIGRQLVRAVQAPDEESRDQMALAATLAGLAFSNCGVALVHALEYPLGAAVHCSHGAGNGLLLPHVMRFNLPTRTAAIAEIGRLLGAANSGDEDAFAAERAIGAVERLQREIGVPTRLRDLGAREEQLPEFAHKAYQIKRLRLINPRAATEQDLLEILRQAF